MAVTVHGRKQLVSADPRNVVDALLELWLAASLEAEGKGKASLKQDAAAEVREIAVVVFSLIFNRFFSHREWISGT